MVVNTERGAGGKEKTASAWVFWNKDCDGGESRKVVDVDVNSSRGIEHRTVTVSGRNPAPPTTWDSSFDSRDPGPACRVLLGVAVRDFHLTARLV